MNHVGPRTFTTVQNKEYRVVDYYSKWSTNFHNDCMLEHYLISLSIRLLLIFIIFLIVLGPRLGPQILQHAKLNSTM